MKTKAFPNSNISSGGGDEDGFGGPRPPAQNRASARTRASDTAERNETNIVGDGRVPPADDDRRPPAAAAGRDGALRFENDDRAENEETKLGTNDDGDEAAAASAACDPGALDGSRGEGTEGAATVEGAEIPRPDDYAAMLHEADDAGDKSAAMIDGAEIPRPHDYAAMLHEADNVGDKNVAMIDGEGIPRSHDYAAMLHEADNAGDTKRAAAVVLNMESNVATCASRAPAATPGRGETSAHPASRGQRPVRSQNQQERTLLTTDVAVRSDGASLHSVPSPPNGDDEENARPPSPLEATLVQSVQEATLIPPLSQNNEPSVPNNTQSMPNNTPRTVYVPVAVATPVSTGWSWYKKFIVVGVTIGAIAAGIFLVLRYIDVPSQETATQTQQTSTQTQLKRSPCQSPLPPPAILVSAPDPSLNLTFASDLGLCKEIVSHNGRENIAIHGNTAIVGAPFNSNGRGSAFVYVKDDNGKWVKQATLVSPDANAWYDRFGWSVGIHDDTVIVGAYLSDDKAGNSGSAYLFLRTRDDWKHLATLHAPDRATDDQFAFSVGIYGDDVIVGAINDDDNGRDSGSAYIFRRNDDGDWAHQAKLVAPDGAAGARFGISVGIYGDTVIIGADRDDDFRGSAYLFVRNNSIWTHQDKLLAPDGAVEDQFGVSVGIYGETVIVGADQTANDEDDSSGSAYLFVRNNHTWTHQAKLIAPDGRAAAGTFGWSVGIYDDTAVVGSVWEDERGVASGSADVYVLTEANWTHRAKLIAPKLGSGKGWSVAIYDDTFFIGSKQEVYVFSR